MSNHFRYGIYGLFTLIMMMILVIDSGARPLPWGQPTWPPSPPPVDRTNRLYELEPETYYNIYYDVMLEAEDEFEISVVDAFDDISSPPLWRIYPADAISEEFGELIQLGVDDRASTQPFEDVFAYRIPIKIDEPGDYILNIYDEDIGGGTRFTRNQRHDIRVVEFIDQSTTYTETPEYLRDDDVFARHRIEGHYFEENKRARPIISVARPFTESSEPSYSTGNASGSSRQIFYTPEGLDVTWSYRYIARLFENIILVDYSRPLDQEADVEIRHSFFPDVTDDQDYTLNLINPLEDSSFQLERYDYQPYILDITKNNSGVGDSGLDDIELLTVFHVLDDHGNVIYNSGYSSKNISWGYNNIEGFTGDFLSRQLAQRSSRSGNIKLHFFAKLKPDSYYYDTLEFVALNKSNTYLYLDRPAYTYRSDRGFILDSDIDHRIDGWYAQRLEYRIENDELPYTTDWIWTNQNAYPAAPPDRIPFAKIWTGTNRVRLRAYRDGKMIEEVQDFIVHRSFQPDAIQLDKDQDELTISWEDLNSDQTYEINGTATQYYYQQGGGLMQLNNILVTEDKEFLDDVDLVDFELEVQFEEDDSKMPAPSPTLQGIPIVPDLPVPWTQSVRLETGYNRVVATAYPVDEEFSNSYNGIRVPPPYDVITIHVEPRIEPAEDIAVLTTNRDIWISESSESDSQSHDLPQNIFTTGFTHDPENGNLVLHGDMNEDGVEDFLQVTEFNTTWAAAMSPSDVGIIDLDLGLFHDESSSQTVLLGDIDQLGLPDIVQIMDNQIWFSRPETYFDYPDPVYLQDHPFLYRPSEGFYLTLEDMTGDGDLDLVQLSPDENGHAEIWIMKFMQSRFDDPVFLGNPEFSWDPDMGWQVVFGDFNGDGLTDIAQNTQFRDVWVALAIDHTGTLGQPTRWASTGFDISTAPDQGQWVFASPNGENSRNDLMFLNRFGEVWIAESEFDDESGVGSFSVPALSATTGFRHDENGGWFSRFGKFAE